MTRSQDIPVPAAGPVQIIAIAGGSCSGKTTLANLLADRLGKRECVVLRTDSYFFTNAGVTEPNIKPNFDAPSAFDSDRFQADLTTLKTGSPVDCPIYDFVTHSRRPETDYVEPKPVVIVEGILTLIKPSLRNLYNYSCFLECTQALRLKRRIYRDTKERGRTEESVRTQFSQQVSPMHDEHVEPTRLFSDYVITQATYLEAIDHVLNKLVAALDRTLSD